MMGRGEENRLLGLLSGEFERSHPGLGTEVDAYVDVTSTGSASRPIVAFSSDELEEMFFFLSGHHSSASQTSNVKLSA
jgi:hypothetical protein